MECVSTLRGQNAEFLVLKLVYI